MIKQTQGQGNLTSSDIDQIIDEVRSSGVVFPADKVQAEDYARTCYQTLAIAIDSGHRPQDAVDRLLIPLLKLEPTAKFPATREVELTTMEKIWQAFRDLSINLTDQQQGFIQMQLGFDKDGSDRMGHFVTAKECFVKASEFPRASNAARQLALSYLRQNAFDDARTAALDCVEIASGGIRQLKSPAHEAITDPFYQCHFFKMGGYATLAEACQSEALHLGLDAPGTKAILSTAGEWFQRAKKVLSSFPEEKHPLMGGHKGVLMLLPGAQMRAYEILAAVVERNVNGLDTVLADAQVGIEYARDLHKPPTAHHVFVQEQIMGLALMAKGFLEKTGALDGMQCYVRACDALMDLQKNSDASRFRYLHDLIVDRLSSQAEQ